MDNLVEKMNKYEKLKILGNEIHSLAQQQEAEVNRLVEHNQTLFQALAKIKVSLERAVKQQPQGLNSAVYASIDLCRSLTPYTDGSTGKVKFDPPLTELEKTLS